MVKRSRTTSLADEISELLDTRPSDPGAIEDSLGADDDEATDGLLAPEDRTAVYQKDECGRMPDGRFHLGRLKVFAQRALRDDEPVKWPLH